MPAQRCRDVLQAQRRAMPDTELLFARFDDVKLGALQQLVQRVPDQSDGTHRKQSELLSPESSGEWRANE